MSGTGAHGTGARRDGKTHGRGGKHSEHVSAKKSAVQGAPKKGGAGGKGTWGRFDYDMAAVEVQKDDPANGSDVRWPAT